MRLSRLLTARSLSRHSTPTAAPNPVLRTLPYAPLLGCTRRYLYTTSICRGIGNTDVGERCLTAATSADTRASGPGKRRALSPEDELMRRVNTLVGQRNATEAVRAVTDALHGRWPSTVREEKRQAVPLATTASLPSLPAEAPRPPSPPVFSSKVFAAALYACDATGRAAEGLALVAEVRRHAGHIKADWLHSEHVLFAVLRLQCAANDRAGATRMFAYLEQHNLLRLRSASVFLRYCCTTLSDRALAFAVYEKALRHKLELTEPDYVALGGLCVRVREPISTLFFMLEEMREHVAEVSSAFVHTVLKPWIDIGNAARKARRAGGESPVYRMEIVERMHECPAAPRAVSWSVCSQREAQDSKGGGGAADRPSPSGDGDASAPWHPPVQRRGVCPACRTELSGYPFTTACRTHLLRELRELVIPQACRSRRALQGFEHWKRYLDARLSSRDRVDIFIDGANLGYYGLSSWYDIAKRALLLHRGVAAEDITAADVDFATQCRSAGRGVDVGVNFELIDSAVRLAVETYGMRRPLVMLHERHVEAKFMTPQSSSIVQRWRRHGWLYCSPTGLNDDLCWLYGALLMTDATDAPMGGGGVDGAGSVAGGRGEGGAASPASSETKKKQAEEEAGMPAQPHRVLVCTNDQMRDHHFRLLSPRAFTRWRDRHRIGFRCARVEDRTELHWDLPAPYERCIQRHDRPRGESAAAATTTTTTWHTPFAQAMADASRGDGDGSGVGGEAVASVVGVSDSSVADAEGDALVVDSEEGGAGGGEGSHAKPAASSLSWVCITVAAENGSSGGATKWGGFASLRWLL